MCQLLFLNRFCGRLGPKTAPHYKNKQKGKLSPKKNKQTKMLHSNYNTLVFSNVKET